MSRVYFTLKIKQASLNNFFLKGIIGKRSVYGLKKANLGNKPCFIVSGNKIKRIELRELECFNKLL